MPVSPARHFLRRTLHRVAPFRFPRGFRAAGEADHWVTFALQRSGQHVVINWICAHLQEVLHLNNVDFFLRPDGYHLTPTLGTVVEWRAGTRREQLRPGPEAVEGFLMESQPARRVLSSFEDWPLDEPLPQRLVQRTEARVLVILRDPYNWLASSMAHGHNRAVDLERKAGILRRSLEEALGRTPRHYPEAVFIDFNRFVSGIEYRRDLAARLGLEFSSDAEQALSELHDFGRGSSFDRLAMPEDGLRVLERWRHFAEDPTYRRILRSHPFAELSERFFGFPDPLRD